MTDYALYMLDPNGIVSNWNTGGQRIKGYSPEDIVGQHFSRFYTPVRPGVGQAGPGAQDRARNRTLRGGRVALRKDGTFFWASVVIDPIRDNAGKLIGYAKITRDISERKQSEERLLRSSGNSRNRKSSTRSVN